MNRSRAVTAYSAAHFAVDFACCFFIFGRLSQAGYGCEAYLVYNFCAFALQMAIGAAADKINRNSSVLLAGCALVFFTYLLPLTLPNVMLCAILGVGNAMFHVGAGLDILNMSDGASYLGIFVSPGAFGLYLGKICARGVSVPHILVGSAPLLMGIVCYAVYYGGKGSAISDNAPVMLCKLNPKLITAAVLFFAVVALRAYSGLTMTFEWNSTAVYGLALTLALMLGKASGGIMADKFGALRTSAVSLLLSCALFWLSDTPICGILAVFLFNMTMPITLHRMCGIFKNAKGFAFGALTFAMYLGFLPAYFGVSAHGGAVYCVFAAVTLLFMLAGLKLEEGER